MLSLLRLSSRGRKRLVVEQPDIALDTGSRLELLRLPLHRGSQAQIQNTGPQLGRNSANRLNDVIGQFQRGASPVANRSGDGCAGNGSR